MDEFYHKDIFGTVVDLNLGQAEEDEEKLPLDKKGHEFNIFALTDALGARDKKRAWILYQQALGAGISAEEVFFKIVWQVKSMLIALKTKSINETDMKPFPYSKAKLFLKNFKFEELEKLSEDLVISYHKARQGVGEIETSIEKLLLGL
jgi:hypothetical protein